MMRLYRLSLTKFLDTALTGEGSRLYGGRWTPPGLPAIYTAQSVSLAVLELLVHVDTAVLNSLRYASITVDVPGEVKCETIDERDLPSNWRSTPAPMELQALGKQWLEGGHSVALTVPSAVVPGEYNTLLNPEHADFRKLVFSEPRHFVIDPRLGKA